MNDAKEAGKAGEAKLIAQLNKAKRELAEIRAGMERSQRGMAYDNAHNNGGYNYQVGPNGGISDYYDWNRA